MWRTGIGYDIHRTAAGRRLVLGGVEIDHPSGLIGHSDADVVLHALCDALLGALGQSDIGELFPDNDPAHKDADSRGFVRQVMDLVVQAGFRVGNADVVIVAEQPKLGPHKPRIRAALAELLAVAPDAVGVKATTNEGVDAIGRGEAIACWATVLLEKVR